MRVTAIVAAAVIVASLIPGSGRADVAAVFPIGVRTADWSNAALPAEEQERELAVVSVAINGAPADGLAYVVRDPERGLWIDDATLMRFGVRSSGTHSLRVDGRTYFPLSELSGISGSIAILEQRLDLAVDPRLLPQSASRYGTASTLRPRVPEWGGFINYGLQGYGALDSNAERARFDVGGTFQAAAYGPAGAGGIDLLAHSADAGSHAIVVVLDVGWRHDDPERLRSFAVGDAISAPGWWGRPVRFGGLQYSSNYALQPGYVTYPLLTVAGVAAVPSAAEIYANNVRLGTQNVPAGPFSITNVPALTGAGELQIVVNNAFGQQQVISQPFYVSAQLLQAGLSEFSYSAGAERFNYGLRSFDYRGWLASGMYRIGVSDQLTMETRAESDRDVRGAGIGTDFVLMGMGVAHGGVAGSQSADDRTGWRVMLGYTRQSQTLGFGVQTSRSSPHYREIGDTIVRQTRASSASLNFALPGRMGSCTIAYSGQRYVDTGRPDPSGVTSTGPLSIYAGSYSVPVGNIGFFSISVNRALGISRSSQAIATVTIPLGARDTNLVLGTQSARADHRAALSSSVDVARAVPIDEGFGFYAHAQTDPAFTAGATYNGPYGRYTLEASSIGGANAVRGSVAGGVGFIDGRTFWARPIDQSFALVEVGGVAGAKILLENVDAGQTGADGTLLLPRIPAYTPVKIAIDATTIPLGNSVDQTDRQIVVMARTGNVIRFRSQAQRSALVRLLSTDGNPIPAGAYARVLGHDDVYPVAEGGEVFIEDFDDGPLDVTYRGRQCRVVLAVPPDAQAIVDVGPLVCELKNDAIAESVR